jgi:hypothetical protein
MCSSPELPDPERSRYQEVPVAPCLYYFRQMIAANPPFVHSIHHGSLDITAHVSYRIDRVTTNTDVESRIGQSDGRFNKSEGSSAEIKRAARAPYPPILKNRIDCRSRPARFSTARMLNNGRGPKRYVGSGLEQASTECPILSRAAVPKMNKV